MSVSESQADPIIGKVLNERFEIIGPLGAGGMGRVYKANQRPLDRVVALKVLNPRHDGTKDPGFERRFFLEASMTAKLKHPNTITVHDYGRTSDGIYFIAMEYVEGDTLQAVLKKKGALPWSRAFLIGAQVARSLREAHRLGLVHRDLKPANVMLLTDSTGGDVVKVLDFGLVKSFTPETLDLVNETDLTQAGVLLGSPLYMAPEQARQEADPRTDIYSLGVLLFHLIAGRPPFTGKESIDLIVKHLREAPPELASLVSGLPLAVNALVMQCLQKSPDARFQSMDKVLDAMRSATSGQGISSFFADPRVTSGKRSLPFSPDAAEALGSEEETRVDGRPPRRARRPADATQLAPRPSREPPREYSKSSEPSRRTLGLVVLLFVLVGVGVGTFAALHLARRDQPPPPPTSSTPPAALPMPSASQAMPPASPQLQPPPPQAPPVVLDAAAEPSAPKEGPVAKPAPRPKAPQGEVPSDYKANPYQ